jgi:pimeloyl-ACP methyl ester carboxylesterase
MALGSADDRARGNSVTLLASEQRVLDDEAHTRAAVARLAPIRAEYPFTPRFHAVAGGRIHYVDEGPRDAEPIVCVHGNPTWSFAFRRIVRAFSATHRVVAIDHLGCGLSDKPSQWDHHLADHAENLRSVCNALDLRRITLVLHDWGGAIGMGFARREPDRIARILALNTAAFPSPRMPLRIRAARMPGIGPFLVRDMNAFALLATRMALHDPSRLTPIARRGLLLPYEDKSSRRAIQCFVEDIPMSASHRSWPELCATADALAQFTSRPVALCWGERDWCFTPQFRAEWEHRFPRARVTRCLDAGHYVFEEAPAEVERALADLLAQPA